MSEVLQFGSGVCAFHRLAIMDLDETGMQPFCLDGSYSICNGELYGFRKMKRDLEAKGYAFTSDSDCEIVLPLYREYGYVSALQKDPGNLRCPRSFDRRDLR